MKITIGVSFGCAQWLQQKLGYDRWNCGRTSRKMHNLCESGASVCVEVGES